MANVFRSKEVLKKTHNENSGDTVVVPVYGVYISGKFNPPFYSNPSVMISQISSRKATIDDLTLKTEGTYDNVLNLLELTIDPSVTIVDYSVDSKNTYDNVLNLLELTIEPTVTIDSYTSDTIGTYDNVLNLLELTIDPSVTIVSMPSNTLNNTPEPGLRLSSIESIKASIT